MNAFQSSARRGLATQEVYFVQAPPTRGGRSMTLLCAAVFLLSLPACFLPAISRTESSPAMRAPAKTALRSSQLPPPASQANIVQARLQRPVAFLSPVCSLPSTAP